MTCSIFFPLSDQIKFEPILFIYSYLRLTDLRDIEIEILDYVCSLLKYYQLEVRKYEKLLFTLGFLKRYTEYLMHCALEVSCKS